jgi:hypothetical protein
MYNKIIIMYTNFVNYLIYYGQLRAQHYIEKYEKGIWKWKF